MPSTKTDSDLTPTAACVVYDKSDGQIVHIHAVVPDELGDTLPEAELHAKALKAAGDTGNLAVLTVPSDLLESERPLGRVDPATGKLVGPE